MKSVVNFTAKAVFLALCALLFAACFIAVGLSTANPQVLANADADPTIRDGQAYSATPRLAANNLSYNLTTSGGVEGTSQTGTLDAAINAINASTYGGTIRLVQNVTISAGIPRIANNTTLDLATYTLMFTAGEIEVSGGDFTVTGSESGKLTNSSGSTIDFYGGTLRIKGGIVETVSGNRAIYNRISDTTVEVSGGTVKSSSNTAIENDGGIIKINGGTVSSSSGNAILNGGTVEINSGKVLGIGSNVVAILNYGDVNMDGGEVKAINETDTSVTAETGSAIHNMDDGAVYMTAGTVSASGANASAIYNLGYGLTYLSGSGKILATGAYGVGIYKKSTGKLFINGGEVSGYYGIRNSSDVDATGAIDIYAGKVSTTSGVAILTYNANVTLTYNGKIESTATDGKGHGIDKVGLGTVTISGTVSSKSGIAIFATNTTKGTLLVNEYATVSSGGSSAIYVEGIALTVSDRAKVENTGAEGGNAIFNGGKSVNITGGTITASSGPAIDNSKGKPLYISGTPTIASGKTYAINTNVAIYGSNEDTTNKYTGTTNITVNYSGTIAAGTTVVNNNTDTNKFSLTNTDYGLKSNGSSLVAENAYTVTLNYNGVMLNGTNKILSGKKATKPANPSGAGFTFGGWYKEDTFINVFDFNTAVLANTTVYAKWTMVVADLTDAITRYTGSAEELTLSLTENANFNYSYLWKKGGESKGTTATLSYTTVADSGTYICTVTATPKSGTNTITATKSVQVTVNPKQVTIPAIDNKIYNNLKQTSGLKGTDYTLIDDGGGNKVGRYEATLKLKDSANCEWSDGSIENKTLQYFINHTAEYNDFITGHGSFIGFNPAALTYTQFSNNGFKEMLAAYNKLGTLEKAQLNDESKKSNIENLQKKYTEIANAKDAAEQAIMNLGYTGNAATLAEICAKGIDDLKGKFTGATGAISGYTVLSTATVDGLVLANLGGNANYTAVEQLITDYSNTLKAVNTALGDLDGKTAKGIKSGMSAGVKSGTLYTLADVKALILAAETAYTAFVNAGGNNTAVHSGLRGYVNIGLAQNQVTHYTNYKGFHSKNEPTWKKALNALSLADGKAINDLKDEQKALHPEALALLEEFELSAIKAVTEKYVKILAAKGFAETALAQLGLDNGETILSIRNSGLTPFEAKIAAAKAAMLGYTTLSTGLTEADLSGNGLYGNAGSFVSDYKAKLALANAAIKPLIGKTAKGIKAQSYTLDETKTLYATAAEAYDAFYRAGGDKTSVHPGLLGHANLALIKEEIAAYEGYKTFYDRFKTTWETALDETVKTEKAEIDAMATAYRLLSQKSKELLDPPERKTIENVIENVVLPNPILGDGGNSALNVVLLIDNLILILLIVVTLWYIAGHHARKRQKALAEADKPLGKSANEY